MLEKLKKAKPIELEVWMWGAGVIGFGLGALLAGYIRQYAAVIAISGIILHGWAMFKIYKK